MNLLPDMEGTIDRRLLVNFRVDPEIAARIVPAPFRPNLSHGVAIAGICLIRLTELRPRGLPRQLGITSESAAHRFAVEWDTTDSAGHGVYIPRRDTDSRLSVALGGRLFPGEHHRARVATNEHGGHYEIELRSADARNDVAVVARESRTLPDRSVFAGIDAASEFFRRDTLGYSQTRVPGAYDGIELDTDEWTIDPLTVEHVRSSFFEDPTLFPPGTVEFDCALSMRRTHARWRSRPQVRVAPRPRSENRSVAARSASIVDG